MSLKTKTSEQTYVTIKIAGELFGLNVNKVKEVIGLSGMTRIPNVLPYMKGIINLRGKAIPLVDMRLKFGLEDKEYDKHTVIVIVKIKKRLIGLIVDSVLDVLNIESDEIQDTPHFASEASSDCIKGVVHAEDRTVVIMDVDRIFTEKELTNITE